MTYLHLSLVVHKVFWLKSPSWGSFLCFNQLGFHIRILWFVRLWKGRAFHDGVLLLASLIVSVRDHKSPRGIAAFSLSMFWILCLRFWVLKKVGFWWLWGFGFCRCSITCERTFPLIQSGVSAFYGIFKWLCSVKLTVLGFYLQ